MVKVDTFLLQQGLDLVVCATSIIDSVLARVALVSVACNSKLTVWNYGKIGRAGLGKVGLNLEISACTY